MSPQDISIAFVSIFEQCSPTGLHDLNASTEQDSQNDWIIAVLLQIAAD